MRNLKSGFTLIELVLVITIIGILAAIALPKFADLQADARLAKMSSALGSVKSAAAMAHAALLARSIDSNFTGTPVPAVIIEGTTVVYTNGYPDAATIIPLAGLNGDYVTTGLTAPAIAAPDSGHVGATVGTDCTIGYTAAAAGSQPTYGLNATRSNCS